MEYAEDILNREADARYETAIRKNRWALILNLPLMRDGNQFCYLYGANLQEGVAGFGDTPELAMLDFDKNFKNTTMWMNGIKTTSNSQSRE